MAETSKDMELRYPAHAAHTTTGFRFIEAFHREYGGEDHKVHDYPSRDGSERE